MVAVQRAYVTSLLMDALQRCEAVKQRAVKQQQAQAALDAQVLEQMAVFKQQQAAVSAAQAELRAVQQKMAKRNQYIGQAHQEMSRLRERESNLQEQVAREQEGALYEQLADELERATERLEDLTENLEAETATIAEERRTAESTSQTVATAQQAADAAQDALLALQAQLPAPDIYNDQFAALLAAEHCGHFVNLNAALWRQHVHQGIEDLLHLHERLHQGYYRLDRHSELLGGRSAITVEALYGAVAVGDMALAQRFFEQATSEDLFFHQISHVFRCWCLGLYVTRRHDELTELLRLHQHGVGPFEIYSRVFIGLLSRDAWRVQTGLKDLVAAEWKAWAAQPQQRGLGVVCVPGLALVRLAKQAEIAVPELGDTVPRALLG